MSSAASSRSRPARPGVALLLFLLGCSQTADAPPTWQPGTPTDAVGDWSAADADPDNDAGGLPDTDPDGAPTPDAEPDDAPADTPGDTTQPPDVSKDPPKLVVKVKGVETTLHTFQVNPALPNSPVKAAAEVFNAGTGPLVLADVGWQSDTLQLSVDWAWQEPFTFDDLPLTIEPGAKRSFLVTYDPNVPSEDQGLGRMTLKSNDPQRPNLELLFNTPCKGAKPLLKPSSHVFVNASPQAPQEFCVQLGNVGCEPFTFESVAIQPADPQYQITQTPLQGLEIPQLGMAPNYADNLQLLPICVRFTPNGTKSPSPVDLVVQVQQLVQTKTAKAKLSADWQAASSFALTCDTGAHLLDFKTAPKRACELQNLGPAVLNLDKAQLLPVLDTQLQSALDAALPFQILKDDAKLQLPAVLAPNQTARFEMTWKLPPNSAPMPARLDIGYSQAGPPATLSIPVAAGACTAPAPEFGPNPMGFHSPSGATQQTAWIANQSCSPLRLIKACATMYNVTQDSPCETGAQSALYFPTFQPVTVAPWGMAGIPLKFQSGDASQTHHGILHVYWCAGEWTGGACKGKTVVTKFNLVGSARADLVAPKLAIAPVVGAQAGRPVRLQASATVGSQPLSPGSAYQWTLQARPPGSTAWLYHPMTDGAELVFVPDRPGSYTIAATVSASGAGADGPSTSAPATVTFQVAY